MPTEALAQFEAWAKLDPAPEKHEDLQAGLAVSHWALGHRDDALAAYRRLVGLRADYAREDYVAKLDWKPKEIALLSSLCSAAAADPKPQSAP